MSGGVGPTSGDTKIREELPAASAPRRVLLSFTHLSALAIALVLSFTGMVPLQDLAFAVFSTFYLFFLSSFAFPPPPSPAPSVFSPSNRLLSTYVTLAAVVGLLLPIFYILHGVLEGDKPGVQAAAPHLFLLAAQIVLEGVTFASRLSLPVRAFVPIFFNGRRMLTIVDWIREEIQKEAAPARLLAGRALAAANFAFWGFNLCGFLLPVYLPRAMKMHYLGKEKV